MLNIVYGTLQTLLSETLPYELIGCKTIGEMRDRLVGCYNNVIGKGQEAFADFLKAQKGQEPNVGAEEENDELSA